VRRFVSCMEMRGKVFICIKQQRPIDRQMVKWLQTIYNDHSYPQPISQLSKVPYEYSYKKITCTYNYCMLRHKTNCILFCACLNNFRLSKTYKLKWKKKKFRDVDIAVVFYCIFVLWANYFDSFKFAYKPPRKNSAF
jgi:hypothetical protein